MLKKIHISSMCEQELQLYLTIPHSFLCGRNIVNVRHLIVVISSTAIPFKMKKGTEICIINFFGASCKGWFLHQRRVKLFSVVNTSVKLVKLKGFWLVVASFKKKYPVAQIIFVYLPCLCNHVENSWPQLGILMTQIYPNSLNETWWSPPRFGSEFPGLLFGALEVDILTLCLWTFFPSRYTLSTFIDQCELLLHHPGAVQRMRSRDYYWFKFLEVFRQNHYHLHHSESRGRNSQKVATSKGLGLTNPCELFHLPSMWYRKNLETLY